MKAEEPGCQSIEVFLLDAQGVDVCHLRLHTVDRLRRKLGFIPQASEGTREG